MSWSCNSSEIFITHLTHPCYLQQKWDEQYNKLFHIIKEESPKHDSTYRFVIRCHKHNTELFIKTFSGIQRMPKVGRVSWPLSRSHLCACLLAVQTQSQSMKGQQQHSFVVVITLLIIIYVKKGYIHPLNYAYLLQHTMNLESLL